ncbi:MAG: tetratricopeptide repeat protein, partial [Candidatus Absconditabacterales bacterium]|nr:tetratricopeptide repeat protein [Candidatus Absconditabacterales bacterium]
DALFYIVKSREFLDYAIHSYTKKRVLSTIERFKIKVDTKKIERRVVDLESLGEYEKAIEMAELLPVLKKTYYKARILYYYYHNYEKVLKVIDSAKKTTPEIDFIKGQVFIKSSLYDEAEKIFQKMIIGSENEFFESAVWNIAEIYNLKGDEISLKKFAVKLWEEHGNTDITGKVFLKYSELLENIGRPGQAKDIIKFILFNFSDNNKIFEQASNRYEKNNIKVSIDELKRDINDSILKLKTDVSAKKSNTNIPKKVEISSNYGRRKSRFNSKEEQHKDKTNLEEDIDLDSEEIIYIEDNDSEEINYIEDTILEDKVISTSEIIAFDNELKKSGNDFLNEEEKRKKELLKKLLPGQILSYFNLTRQIEDYDLQIEMSEKLIQYSSEIDFPELRNIAIVALAEASIEKVGDIEKVVKFFYVKIREYVRKYAIDKKDDKDKIISDFYVKAVEFFALKGYLKEAYELCENYYNEIDPSYKEIAVLKEKINIAVQLGEIEKKDLEKIISKDKDFIDSFIIKKELFNNQYITDLGNKLRELEKTDKVIKELGKLKTISQKYRYFRDNDFKQKIADNYYDIIGEFKDSFEVFSICWDCVLEKEKYNDAVDIFGIVKDRFKDKLSNLKNREKLLEYIFANYDTVRILDIYGTIAPVNIEYIEKIDFSVFSKEFIFTLIELDKDNIFLKDKYIDILLESGNSSEILSFLKKYNDFIAKVFDYYIKTLDYELLDFYYSEFSEYANNKVINVVNIYRGLINKKNNLNTSDTSSGENIEEIIRMAAKLGLFDEAINYSLVLNRITGIDVKHKIEELNIQRNIYNINNAALDKKNEFLLAKQYLIYIDNNKDTKELDVSEDIKVKAEELKKIEKELMTFTEDTVEIVVPDLKKDTEETNITMELFKENIKKNKKDKAIDIGNKLLEKGYFEVIPELGKLYEEKRDYKKAVEFYREFVINDISSELSPELQYKIGLIAMKERDEDKAVYSFERLLRYFPDEEVYTAKALTRIEKILEEGIVGKEFEQELDLFDKTGDYNEINRFQDISDNIDEIKTEISKTNDTYRLSLLHYKLGDIYFEKFKKYNDALLNYIKAKDYGEKDIALMEKIADCYIKQRKYDEAIENYENYVESLVDPEEKATVTLKIIKIYTENLKQYSEALEKINVYIAEYSFTEAYYEVLYYKAKIFEEHYRDYTEAIKQYEILVPEFGSDFAAKAQFRIAYIYEKYLKQYVNAKTAYEKIINDFTDFDLKTQAEDALRGMEEDGKI